MPLRPQEDKAPVFDSDGMREKSRRALDPTAPFRITAAMKRVLRANKDNTGKDKL